jgi:hypothetical protein
MTYGIEVAVEVLEQRHDLEEVRALVRDARGGPEAPRRPDGRLPGTTVLRRVFAIEVLVCPRCAGRAGSWIQ